MKASECSPPGGDGDRGSHQSGAALRAERRTHRLPQRLPDEELGHPRRHDRAEGPESDGRAYFPSLLEPRRAEKALHGVVVEADVKGVPTHEVDDLVKTFEIDGISRSKVSNLKVLDTESEPSSAD